MNAVVPFRKCRSEEPEDDVWSPLCLFSGSQERLEFMSTVGMMYVGVAETRYNIHDFIARGHFVFSCGLMSGLGGCFYFFRINL